MTARTRRKTISRLSSLNWVVSRLLNESVLRTPGSEILLAHGSNASLLEAQRRDGACPACASPRVRHIDVVAIDATGLRVASRFFAAASAANQVRSATALARLPRARPQPRRA